MQEMATLRANVRRRKSLSIAQKVEIIRVVETGGQRKSDVAARFGIARSTLSTILKVKEKVMADYERSNTRSDRKRIRLSQFDDLERAVYQWFVSVRARDIPVTGPMIQQKAMEYARELGHVQFTASSGWLQNFKDRHNIAFRAICGESEAVSPEDVTEWITHVLPDLIKDYASSDIFNADETGLFYRMTPDRTLAFRGEQCHGGKRSKERITVMLCSNMDGSEKIQPLVIGKFQNPRCFRGIRTLPVKYYANKKAWMTTEIYENWLLSFDRKMKQQNRKVLLFVDNCSAHTTSLNLEAVKVQKLPANTTSKLQPMDQGIIQNLKVHYRKQLLQRLILNIDTNDTRVITVKDAIDMLDHAWKQVKQQTIANCFRKAGFAPSPCVLPEDTQDESDEQREPAASTEAWEQLNESGLIPVNVTFNDFVTADNSLLVNTEPTDQEILDNARLHAEQQGDADTDDDDPVMEIPSVQAAFVGLTSVKVYLQSTSNVPDNILGKLSDEGFDSQLAPE